VTLIKHSPYCFGKILDYLRSNESLWFAEEKVRESCQILLSRWCCKVHFGLTWEMVCWSDICQSGKRVRYEQQIKWFNRSCSVGICEQWLKLERVRRVKIYA
jgi:hypothetical protein